MSVSSFVIALALLLLCARATFAGVTINELMAAASDTSITYQTDGAPRLGSGKHWMEPGFPAGDWSLGYLPAGYGFAGLGTNIQAHMRDKAYSLYLRKEFTVSPELSSSTNPLVLSVQFNDGFVAYLNGQEVARANCGPTNHFMFSSQPAYNVNGNQNLIDYGVGSASTRLRPGVNVLAIQAHNADRPDQISAHTPTTDFRINAGLRVLSLDTNLPNTLVIQPALAGGLWRMFIGRAEPSGGVTDLGLVNRAFTPPVGEDGDFEEPPAFSDWVELYNDSDAPADISGWTLSDDAQAPGKWAFPVNTFIPARGYLLVLCDDRDEANAPLGPATRLHASFKLSSDGDVLLLSDKSGKLVDSLASKYPPQLPNYSFGRSPANRADWVYMASATPGAPNAGQQFPGIVPPPKFQDAQGRELPGGLYAIQPFSLHLFSSAPGATVVYTLNGSDPTSDSPQYTGPITISQANERMPVVVRARAFIEGWLPSKTVTHTYVLRQPQLLSGNPAIFLSATPGRTFYAPEGVLAVVGGTFTNSVWGALNHNSYNIALGSGAAFERETWMECFFPNNFGNSPRGFSAGAGIRISASPWQRPRMNLSSAATVSPWPVRDTTQKPSFNLYFTGDYGPGPLDFHVLTNSPLSEYRHLRLRAGKNDNYNPFITDELARRLSLDLGLAGARGLFCSLYVNGTYKGVYNLCERLREPFFQAFYQNSAEWDVCYSHDWVNGDSLAYQRLVTSLERDLTLLGNWQSVTNQVDVDNAADYFLLNIYGSTWDWPGNNFVMARARVGGPEGRFRFAVWDAEGTFQAVTSLKPINYNTLTNDLLVPPGNGNYYGLLARIFRRLCTSPEFRLRFADRVNLHMFNQGVLDDRDPDMAGPLKSKFRTRLDELVAEAGNLVRYNTGQTLNISPFLAWVAPANGRRSYLLGSTPGRQMLRDSGLWPRTEPPVFSQHGGLVPPGYSLSITSYVAQTGQTAVVYYTTNGIDPRLGVAPIPEAIAYNEPFEVQGVQTISARALNTTTGEWSPLTRAAFAVAAVPASTNNLAVVEVMYHPPAETPGEVATGFQNADDFEFLRVQNIGQEPIDLRGVNFVNGVAFSFSRGRVHYLPPGGDALVVKNRAAFQARYGFANQELIAGEYEGNLSNGGERLVLADTNSAVLRDFTYLDKAPWPIAADGLGPSLVLREPTRNPDHARPENWSASSVPGGIPWGSSQPLYYEQWRFLCWDRFTATNNSVASQSADPDRDGISNFAEYALGLNPHVPEVAPRTHAELQALDEGGIQLVLRITVNPGARQANILWQTRDGSGPWLDSTQFELVAASRTTEGRERRIYSFRAGNAQGSSTKYIRAVVRETP